VKKRSRRTATPPECDPIAPPTDAEYLCVECGEKGPYHLFQEHARECLRGAPKILPDESFDAWSARVQEWRADKNPVCPHPEHRLGTRGGLKKHQRVCLQCVATVLVKKT
jgi:hypothetical protein